MRSGDLKTPPFAAVREEFLRINRLLAPLSQPRQLVAGADGAPGRSRLAEALTFFAAQLNASPLRPLSPATLADERRSFNADERQKRQVKGLEKHVQSLVRGSERVRQQFFLHKVMPELADETWSMRLRHSTFPAAKFIEGAKSYRRYFREEILGKFDEPPASAQRAHPAGLRQAEVDRLRGGAGRLARRLRLGRPAGAERHQAGRAAAGGGLPARPQRPAQGT